ncbi:MAG: hypothetical protein Q8R55_02365 [Candidatus Taylorbacteria bacterium]|nr:hypothetical protein [Candidatus Taylorbacteria bacterium]
MLFAVAVLAVLGYLVYINIFYLNGKHLDIKNISLENYKNLPQLVESWSGTKKIIPVENYRYLKGNDKVKRINKVNNKIAVSLYFAEPDKEDNVEKRSATINYTFPSLLNTVDTVFFTVIEPQGNIIGKGHQRSRIQFELTDVNGKTMMGPKIPFSDKGKTYLILRPTTAEPIPTGSFKSGFDVNKVARITVRFILAGYPEGISKFPASGKLYIDNIYAITNLEPLVNLFGQANRERVTRDNMNFSYKIRKVKWNMEKHDFFIGINYPWNNYGWDIGKNPYGLPENSGWSRSENEDKLRKDFTYFKNVDPDFLVRIYLFFDLRTGLEYTTIEHDGITEIKLGFDQYVRKDIETLFRVAGETGIKLDLVLFDFGMADGQGGTSGGEHPELIFSSEKHNFLTNLMLPLLQDMEKWDNQYGNPVFAVELMNEPENMAALMVPGYFQSLKVWFQDLTNIIHNETSFKVTLGSHSIVDMQRWWSGIDIDIWQFHFYKYMAYEHDLWPQNLKREDIKLDGMIFAGEMQPYDIGNNIEILKENGYDGILFWAWNTNDGYGLRGKKEMEQIINWIKLNKTKEAK